MRIFLDTPYEYAPNLRIIGIEINYSNAVGRRWPCQPGLIGKGAINLPIPPHFCNPRTYFADHLHRKKNVFGINIGEKRKDSWVAPLSFAKFTDDISVNQIRHGKLAHIKGIVVIEIWHRGENLNQGTFFRLWSQ